MKISWYAVAAANILIALLLYCPEAYCGKSLTHEFSNACAVPELQTINLPRTVSSLKKSLDADFKVIKSRNFIIATDLDDVRADYVINGVFASCHDILINQFFEVHADDPVVIFIFKDKKSYYSGLKKYFKMQPVSPYGHYANSQRYIVVNYSTGPGTLVHELTHALMAVDFPQAPIWICEGMASLFEQCRVESGKLVGEQNWRLPELHKGVRDNRLTPLRILFQSDTREFRMLRESLHYAQSRYFCKFLEEKGVLGRVYKAFRKNVTLDRTGISVVETALGKNIDEIEEEWIEWIKTQNWEEKHKN